MFDFQFHVELFHHVLLINHVSIFRNRFEDVIEDYLGFEFHDVDHLMI